MATRFACGFGGLLLGMTACGGPFAGGQTGSPVDDGASMLLACETDTDCTSHPDAYRCADDGYCVDRNGKRVRVLAGDGGLPLAHERDGGADGEPVPGPLAGTGGSGGAGGTSGAGGSSATPVETPPAKPFAACPANLPEPEASCTPTDDPACSLGGFTCSCQCDCASSQGADPPQCFEPCDWRCQFDALDALLTEPDVAIDITCDDANPDKSTITASATVTYAADADGPPLTIDAASGMYLEFEGQGNCTLEGVPTPDAVGPIAPGDSMTITHTQEAARCLGGGGGIGYFCPKLCNAGARVGFTLKVAGGGAATTQYRSWFLGDGPRGAVYTARCTP